MRVKEIPPAAPTLLTVGLFNCSYSSMYGSDTANQRIVATSYAEAEKKFHSKYKNFTIQSIIYEGVVGL